MKLNEPELLEKVEEGPKEPPCTSLTITHIAKILDERTGMIESRVLRFPLGDPDLHLGAVCD